MADGGIGEAALASAIAPDILGGTAATAAGEGGLLGAGFGSAADLIPAGLTGADLGGMVGAGSAADIAGAPGAANPLSTMFSNLKTAYGPQAMQGLRGLNAMNTTMHAMGLGAQPAVAPVARPPGMMGAAGNYTPASQILGNKGGLMPQQPPGMGMMAGGQMNPQQLMQMLQMLQSQQGGM
jgi:hypothetical protein